MITNFRQIGRLLVTATVAVISIGIVAAIVIAVRRNLAEPDPTITAAVVTNGEKCAQIGRSILEKHGTAVDAAIAALFCEGASLPHCMGLGGGFFMTIYKKDSSLSEFLDSREVAPSNVLNEERVAVPGELMGYWEAYHKHGKGVPWRDLIEPTVKLCKEGILVTEYLEKVYSSHSELIFSDQNLRETFIDPRTNQPYRQNQHIKRPRLAKTLELVAILGPGALYNGTLTNGFIRDINGGITRDDLADYKPQWKEPVRIELPFEQVLYTSPPPGSGAILGMILNILNGFLDYSKPSSMTNWQRIIESFKFAFAKRTELGDPDYPNVTDIFDLTIETIRSKIKDGETSEDSNYYGTALAQIEDHGGANLCVLAPNGDAVAVTSTINHDFGAGFMSGSTGIILNDQMDAFSSSGVPSPNNFVEAGKRPVSSMSPSIVVGSDGNVRLVIGGSGGTKIITSVALVLIKHLWFNLSIEESVAHRRLHHQLSPMSIQFEEIYKHDMDFVNSIEEFGHNYTFLEPDGSNSVTSIAQRDGKVEAAFDPRRGGATSFITD